MKPEDARSRSTQRLLFREQVFPVCATSLLGGQTVPLGDPAQLAALPLIYKQAHATDRRGRAPELQRAAWEWTTWFRRIGIGGRPKQLLKVDDARTTISRAMATHIPRRV